MSVRGLVKVSMKRKREKQGENGGCDETFLYMPSHGRGWGVDWLALWPVPLLLAGCRSTTAPPNAQLANAAGRGWVRRANKSSYSWPQSGVFICERLLAGAAMLHSNPPPRPVSVIRAGID